MLDLLCVNPRLGPAIYGDLGDLVAKEPPLWCRLIAAYARDRGFKVGILDADALGLDGAAVRDEVLRLDPRLVAVVAFGHQPSASTEQMVGARDVLLQLKDLRDTILVGGHVSALPVKTFLEEDATYACKGEGPVTIVSLLRDTPDMFVPGLVWWSRDRNDVVVNKPAPLVPMEDLHGDAWDLLPKLDVYRAHNWQCLDGSPRSPYASVMTSLGCPYSCSFCCINAPFDANKYRTRDPKAVVEEMVNLRRRHGVNTFKIVDEMFVLKPSHYLTIVDLLAEVGMGDANVWAYARVDTVEPKNLERLRRGGVRWLALGIESGSAHVRDGSQKSLDQLDIVKTVKAIQSRGISVIGNYIFGLPDDTRTSMLATVDLALTCLTEFANFYSAMAYPGSKLYEQHKDYVSDDWRAYSQVGPHSMPLGTHALTPLEVLEFRDEAFRRYFFDPRYRAVVADKFGPVALEFLDGMLERKLVRAA